MNQETLSCRQNSTAMTLSSPVNRHRVLEGSTSMDSLVAME
jgi:hypothetical protein